MSAGEGLVWANKLLVELGKLHYDVKGALQQFETRHEDLRRCLAEAWQERQDLLGAYFDLARSVAGLCEEGSDVPCAGLRQLLERHGFEPLDAARHVSFDPAVHECARTVAVEGVPEGEVVEVVARGLVRHVPGQGRIVVAPARVVVNRHPDGEGSGGGE